MIEQDKHNGGNSDQILLNTKSTLVSCDPGVKSSFYSKRSALAITSVSMTLPMFSRVSFSTVPMLTLFSESVTPKFKMAPENRKQFYFGTCGCI